MKSSTLIIYIILGYLTIISCVEAYFGNNNNYNNNNYGGGLQPSQIRYEDRHSFKAPFISTSSGILYWDIYGDAIIAEEYIRLTSDMKGIHGSMWNSETVEFPSWEVVMDFRIGGPSRLGADGIAFWYADRRHNAEVHDTSIYGSKNSWKGLGIMFDTFDNNANGDNPLVTVVYNDGSQFYDVSKDGLNMKMGSCTSKFRSASKNAKAKIRYFNGILSVLIDPSSSGTFDPCVSDIRINIPQGYSFGISAATGGLHDNHDVYSIQTSSLDPPAQTYFNDYQQAQQQAAQLQAQQQAQQQVAQQQAAQQQQHQPPVVQDNQTPGDLQAQIEELTRKYQQQQQQEYEAQQQQAAQQQQQTQQAQHVEKKVVDVPKDEQLPYLINKVDNLKEAVNQLHATMDQDETKKSVEGLRDQVNNIGQALVALAGSVVTKKEFTEFKNAYDQKQNNFYKDFNDLKSSINDMKASIKQRLNNQDQDMTKTLESISQNVNVLKRSLEATSKDTQKIASTLQINANEIASTIEKQTSFGFWAYFLFVQAIFLFGFVFWRKYKDENNKKLI